MTEYRACFEWLDSIFHSEDPKYMSQSIRDQAPAAGFAAYARLFPPVEICHPVRTRHRWDELAHLCGTELAVDTTWDDLVHAIASTSDGPLRHVGPDAIESCAWDISRKCRTLIGSILSLHSVSERVFYGVWDGYRAASAAFTRYGYFDLKTRCYHTWSGQYSDFGRFHAVTPNGRICPQDIAWPSSRSWFYRIDTDWTSGLIAGSQAMIASLVAASELEILEVDGDMDGVILEEISHST